jgi:hypothetical protein
LAHCVHRFPFNRGGIISGLFRKISVRHSPRIDLNSEPLVNRAEIMHAEVTDKGFPGLMKFYFEYYKRKFTASASAKYKKI